MKRIYQINDETFRCEPQARHRLEELKLSVRLNDKIPSVTDLSIWEITETSNIFGDTVIIKQLVTQYTHGLPSNGIFRIRDAYDVRRSKHLYCMQKYDSENHCWNNYKLGDDLGILVHFMNITTEVR